MFRDKIKRFIASVLLVLKTYAMNQFYKIDMTFLNKNKIKMKQEESIMTFITWWLILLFCSWILLFYMLVYILYHDMYHESKKRENSIV